MSNKKKKDFREEDLYKPVCEYLSVRGYTVRGEVKHCDVAAVKGEELLVVEMKKSLNLDLILQAALRQKLADMVYIAVPKPGRDLFSKRWKDLFYLLKRLQFGLMLVSIKEDISYVEVAFEPQLFDMTAMKKRNKKKKQGLLDEFDARHGDFNIGGSTKKKLVTAYREQAIHIACCLMKFGQMSTKALRELGTDGKKTAIILKNNHYKWFDPVSEGFYDINEKGRQEVAAYAELHDYYMRQIESRKSE